MVVPSSGTHCCISSPDLLRTPLLIKIHGSHAESFGPLPRMHRICRHLILRLSTALGVLSSSEVDEFRAAWPWLPDKVLVVKNVLRSEFLRAEVKDHHRPVVFFTSRFVAKKGRYDLLEAAAEITRVRPHVRFVFIGDGPESAAFRARVAERGLQAQVVHFPHKSFDQLIDLYSEGGIFVFPTHFPEGMPMALMEAMAVGLLAVSAPIRFAHQLPVFGTHPELLLHSGKAFAPQIVGIVGCIIDDADLRQRAGAQNKAYAAQFSQQAVAEEFVRLYARIGAA